MTTLKFKRRMETHRKTGKRCPVYDMAIHAGRRLFAATKQGYTRLTTMERVWKGIEADIKAGRVKINYSGLHPVRSERAARAKARAILRIAARTTVVIIALTASVALAVNSPRPASYRVQDGALVVTWTNLSEAHPWLLSYRRDMNQPWQWDTTRLHAVSRSLTVAIPMEAEQGFYRLWPAAPEQ